MQTVKARLIEFLKYEKIGQKKFAEKVGVSFGFVNAIRASIGPKTLQKIKDAYPHLNIEWLMTGDGQMLTQTVETPQREEPELPKPEISYTEGVPYYDEDFFAGFSEIMPTGHEHPDYLIKMPGYEKATLWCNVSGHSMEPEISGGDIVALQKVEDFSFLPYGEVYGIITTNGLRTVKRLGKSTLEGHYRLIPTNKEYDDQDIPVDKIACVYRVMGAMKPF